MKINKSKLMKRAWQIAKNLGEKWYESASSFLSSALKQAWKEARLNIDELKKLGNEWIGYGNHRIYFDEIEKYFDSVCHKAHKRRVNGAQVNRAELDSKVSAKVWFDVNSGEFCQKWNHLSSDDMEIVKRNILAAI